MSILLNENDFVWRTPDYRTPDIIASYEIPQDIDYQFVEGDEFKVIVPAKAYIETNATPAIEATSSDIANAAVNSTALTITFQLPQLIPTNYYDIKDIVEIITVSGTSYTKLGYGTTAGNWEYDSSTKTFTVHLSSVASVTLWIYYTPQLGTIDIVHRIPGGVKTTILVSNSTTNQHIMYDPGLAPVRIKKNEYLAARTYIDIVVYPRTINNTNKYKFDPLRPDGSISDVCLIELPIHRV